MDSQLSATLTVVFSSDALSFMPDLNVTFIPSTVQVYQSKSLIWSNGHLGAQSDECNIADVAQVVCELVWPSYSLIGTLMIFFYFYECDHLLSVVSDLSKKQQWDHFISTLSASEMIGHVHAL